MHKVYTEEFAGRGVSWVSTNLCQQSMATYEQHQQHRNILVYSESYVGAEFCLELSWKSEG